jgi:hypothetical protein
LVVDFSFVLELCVVVQVDTHLEYHVLRLSIATEQMDLSPIWLNMPEYVLAEYNHNWDIFNQNRAISAQLLHTPLLQLSLMELWLLCDVLEHGRIVSTAEMAAAAPGTDVIFWVSPTLRACA